jgi:P27 family predicted phage terminase small subunit
MAAPRGLTPYARRVWRRFWRSQPSLAVDHEADAERLHHWIRCVDEREKLRPLVEGRPMFPVGPAPPPPEPGKPPAFQQQYRINPLVYVVRDLSREIEKAEEAFGMTPLSRFRLQITYTDAARATRKMEAEEEDTTDDEDDDDPLAALGG